MQFIDQAGLQILPDSADAAADLDVLVARGGRRLVERFLDAPGDEVEGRAALHDDRLARVMGEDVSRRMVRRVRTPPAFPGIVRPLAADRAEHVAAEDEGAETGHGAGGIILVYAFRAVVLAHHGAEGAGMEEPLEHFRPPLSQGVIQALLRAGAETVHGNGKPCNAHLGHAVLHMIAI